MNPSPFVSNKLNADWIFVSWSSAANMIIPLRSSPASTDPSSVVSKASNRVPRYSAALVCRLMDSAPTRFSKTSVKALRETRPSSLTLPSTAAKIALMLVSANVKGSSISTSSSAASSSTGTSTVFAACGGTGMAGAAAGALGADSSVEVPTTVKTPFVK